MFESRVALRDIFAEEASRLDGLYAESERSEQRVAEAVSELSKANRKFGEHFIAKRLLARLGSLVGVSTIYSPIPENIKRTDEARQMRAEYNRAILSASKNLEEYGSNFPGRHRLVEIGYDTGSNQFSLEFVISLGKHPPIYTEGTFDSLRYRVVSGAEKSLRIPVKDFLAPIAYVPSDQRITVCMTEFGGSGRFAYWEPKPNSTPAPLNPKEFIFD